MVRALQLAARPTRDRLVTRAKIADVIWIVLGSILWLARYRIEYTPGPLGIVVGLAGFVLAWSVGGLLNLVA